MSKIVCLTLRAGLSKKDLTLLGSALTQFVGGDNPPADAGVGVTERLVHGSYPKLVHSDGHPTTAVIVLQVRDGFDPEEVIKLAREHFANQRTGIEGDEAVRAIDS